MSEQQLRKDLLRKIAAMEQRIEKLEQRRLPASAPGNSGSFGMFTSVVSGVANAFGPLTWDDSSVFGPSFGLDGSGRPAVLEPVAWTCTFYLKVTIASSSWGQATIGRCLAEWQSGFFSFEVPIVGAGSIVGTPGSGTSPRTAYASFSGQGLTTGYFNWVLQNDWNNSGATPVYQFAIQLAEM